MSEQDRAAALAALDKVLREGSGPSGGWIIGPRQVYERVAEALAAQPAGEPNSHTYHYTPEPATPPSAQPAGEPPCKHNVNPNTDRCVLCGANRWNRERAAAPPSAQPAGEPPWECEVCHRRYAEYVNGCPHCSEEQQIRAKVSQPATPPSTEPTPPVDVEATINEIAEFITKNTPYLPDLPGTGRVGVLMADHVRKLLTAAFAEMEKRHRAELDRRALKEAEWMLGKSPVERIQRIAQLQQAVHGGEK